MAGHITLYDPLNSKECLNCNLHSLFFLSDPSGKTRSVTYSTVLDRGFVRGINHELCNNPLFFSLSPQLTVVRQRDKLEGWFKHFLVEDKGVNPVAHSYVDFLCQMHKEIRNLMN